jgi:tetratricopeptide (TPR) repeat protein
VETEALYIFRLDLIRRQLAELGLDWDAPPLRTAPAGPVPAHLEVEVVGLEEVDPELARKRALSALYFNPFDAEAHFRLGKYLLDAQRYRQAHAHLGAALAFRPGLDAALFPRAMAAYRLRRLKAAHEDFTRHLAKHSGDAEAHHYRGHVNTRLGNHREAVADFTAALKRWPGNAHLLDCRGENYLLLGQHARAAADCLESLESQPEQAGPNRNLAWIHATGPARFRDLARARSFARRAVQFGDRESRTHHCLGVVYYRLGQWQEAVKAFQRALAVRQGKSSAYYDFFLAMCHARLGDRPRARDHYRRAVQWLQAQKGLLAAHVQELKAFQDEADRILGSPGEGQLSSSQ